MEIFEGILKRRSIRKYKDKEIEEEKIKKILKAGMYAPSSRNKRPWFFIVIKDKNILKEIADFHPYGKMLYTAPLAILVCGDKNIQEVEGYIALDCAASTQNILLAALGLGIGSCWIGIYPRKERMDFIKKLLKLEEKLIPISLISLGYPDEEKEMPERFEKEKYKIID